MSPTSQIDDNFPVFKPIFNFSKKLTRLSFSSKQMFFLPDKSITISFEDLFFFETRLNIFQIKRDFDAPPTG